MGWYWSLNDNSTRNGLDLALTGAFLSGTLDSTIPKQCTVATDVLYV